MKAQTQETRIEWMEIHTLRALAHPDNPKKHDVPGLIASMKAFGFRGAIIFDETSGLKNEGHGRTVALCQMHATDPTAPPKNIRKRGKLWFAPVLRGQGFDTKAQAAAFLIPSNRLTEKGGWDAEKLDALCNELRTNQPELMNATGFGEAELSSLLSSLRSEQGSSPNFAPGSADDQGRLDEKQKTKCPECGHEF